MKQVQTFAVAVLVLGAMNSFEGKVWAEASDAPREVFALTKSGGLGFWSSTDEALAALRKSLQSQIDAEAAAKCGAIQVTRVSSYLESTTIVSSYPQYLCVETAHYYCGTPLGL